MAGSHRDFGDFSLRYTISVTPPLISERLKGDIPLETLEKCDNNLPVSSVTSSGNQPTYLPAYAIDNNLNTKWWSTLIVNPFITLDLGAPKSICGADIAWSDGNLHTYKFDISVSTDGTSFTKVFSGTSSGTASSPEKYIIPLTQGRYVKITITESTPSSTRSIAEISEIDIFS
jgi:F5/8 type C domain